MASKEKRFKNISSKKPATADVSSRQKKSMVVGSSRPETVTKEERTNDYEEETNNQPGTQHSSALAQQKFRQHEQLIVSGITPNLLAQRSKNKMSADIEAVTQQQHAISPLDMNKFQDATKIIKQIEHYNTTIASQQA